MKKGFTLIETVVGAAVFAIVALAAYQMYTSLFAIIAANQYQIVALNLANEEFEIARNLSYADVGIPNSVPNGKIPQVQNITRSGFAFVVTTTIRNLDMSFDGTAASSTDTAPEDMKLVEVNVTCPTCKHFAGITLTTNIAPKNLEAASKNGVLFVKVIDASSTPVTGASVHITDTRKTPNVVIDDITNNLGQLQIFDVATDTLAYYVTVSKTGYTSAHSVASSTVLSQQVTTVTFTISKLP